MDLEILSEMLENDFQLMIVEQHGKNGFARYKELLRDLHKIYNHVAPEECSGRITVFKTLNEDDRPLAVEQALMIRDVKLLVNEVEDSFTVQLLDNRQFLLWKTEVVDVNLLAEKAVVYTYENRVEHFYAKQKKRRVPNPYPVYASCFALPSFDNLRDALAAYSIKAARYSSCPILDTSWYDRNRIFFRSAQEETMRRSLMWFLKNTLPGDVEVRPEQVVDESHPVDIKVTWEFSNRRALIEIKWLGKSRDSSGAINKIYSASRARDGAQQLAEYLDEDNVQAPAQQTKGYLVIFDARRRRTSENTSTISREDGLHFRNEEISYDPKYHEDRRDFETPIRLFMEPVCQ